MSPNQFVDERSEVGVSRRTVLRIGVVAMGLGASGRALARGPPGQTRCADGVALGPIQTSIREGATPVSELAPHPAVPDVFEIVGEGRADTKHAWRTQRRDRLKHLIRQYIYGYAPPTPARTFDVTVDPEPVFDGAAVLKHVAIRFPDLPDEAPAIRLAVFVPTASNAPSPVILGMNSFGNHGVADVPTLAYPLEVRERGDPDEYPFGRGWMADYWQIRETIERGYAFATAYAGDVYSDIPELRLLSHAWEHYGSEPGAVTGGELAAWA